MDYIVIHLHAQWEAEMILRLLNAAGLGQIPGCNHAEVNYIANHVARAMDVDGWRNLVNDPEA
jgi:hypothetical protein